MSKYQLRESQIQTSIINYLRAKGWYVQRMNSGEIRTKQGGMVKLASRGTPDIMAFKNIENKFGSILLTILFIEVKRLGNHLTAIQIAKMQELKSYGATCLLIHSLEELQTII